MTLILNTAHAQELPGGIDALLSDVAEEGLPASALESKAREGLAKGVPPQRILGVLEVMRGELLAARDLLQLPADAPDRDEVLSASAAALHAEVSPDTLRRLASLPVSVRGPAIQSVVDLIQLGFSQEQSARLVEDAARHRGEPLSSLTIVSGTLLVQGSSHTDVFQRITAELAAGQSSLIALSQGNGNANNGNNPNANPNASDGAGNASDGSSNGNGGGNGGGNGNGGRN